MKAIKILSFWLCLASGVFATTYYVDATGGDDSNNGLTAGTAWKTLAKVEATTFQSGDVIGLKRGETWFEMLTLATGKHDGIILDAYGSGALPIIDAGPSGTHRWAIHVDTATNTTTRHLQLQNAGGLPAPHDTGALWEAVTGTNTIEDCILHRHYSDACAASGASGTIIVTRCNLSDAFDDGFTLHGNATGTMSGCTISGCGQGINHSGTAITMTVNDCIFQNNVVDVDGLDVSVSTFNRCTFNGNSSGVWSFYKASEASAVTFNYCLFNASLASGVAAASMTIAGPNTRFNNCDFYGKGNGSIVVNADCSMLATNCIFDNWWRAAYLNPGGRFVADYCIFHAIAVKTVSTNTHEVSTSDPLFVAPTSGNFSLQAGSPAMAAGISLGLTPDITGRAVGNPPEVGAYQYPRPTGAIDGFWVMTNDLGLTEQANWYPYNGGDSPEGGYMGWIFAGATNLTATIPLGRTLGPGSYRVFLKVIDYSGKGSIEVSLGQNTSTMQTDNRDWNRYWTYSSTDVIVGTPTSNLAVNLLKSISVDSDQKYLLIGIYITSNPNENTVLYGEDRMASWNYPTATVASTTSGNLIDNSSFEVGLNHGWAFMSDIQERDNTLSSFLDTNEVLHGRTSFLFYVKGTLTSHLYKVRPNRVHTVSVWARSAAPSGFRLEIRNTATAPPDLPMTLDKYEGFETTTDWKRYSFSCVLPDYPNSDYQVQIVGWPGLSVDAVQLEEGSLTDYKPCSSIEIGFTSEKPGRILFEDESPALSLIACNSSGLSFSGTLAYEIYDIYNRKIGGGNRPLSVPPTTRLEDSLPLPVKRGIFRVVAWVKGRQRTQEEATYAVVPRPRVTGVDETSIIGTHPNFVPFELAIHNRLGVKWGRALSPSAIFRWSYVEPVEGEITWYDDKVDRVAPSGMSIMGTICSDGLGPPWALTNGLPDLDKWESFVDRLVTHYKDRVKYWEIWNEPIYSFTPEFYGELLKRAAVAIRRADPSAKIVGMGGVYSKDWILQVMGYLGSNWSQSLDMISTHLYPAGTDPSGGEAEDRAISFKNEVIDRYGVEVWNTETGVWDQGFYKGANSNFSPVGEAAWPHTDSERYVHGCYYEAERLMSNFIHCVGNGLTKYFYYDSRIYASPTYLRTHPTMLEYDDSIRSKGITYSIAAWFLDGSRGLGGLVSNDTTYAYLFDRSGKATVVLWSKDKLNHSIQLPPSDWRAFDMMGNQFALTESTIPFGRTPVYLQSTLLSPTAVRSAFQAATIANRADTAAPNLSLDEFPTGPTTDQDIQVRWLGIDETSIPSASEPAAVTYSYQLEGRDADWSAWTPATHTSLTSLSAGNYTFRVRARDAAGNISTTVSSPITVGSPAPRAPANVRVRGVGSP